MGNPSPNSIPLIVSYSRALGGNAYPRKISVKIGLKKKSAGKRGKEKEKKTNNPICMKVRRALRRI